MQDWKTWFPGGSSQGAQSGKGLSVLPHFEIFAPKGLCFWRDWWFRWFRMWFLLHQLLLKERMDLWHESWMLSLAGDGKHEQMWKAQAKVGRNALRKGHRCENWAHVETFFPQILHGVLSSASQQPRGEESKNLAQSCKHTTPTHGSTAWVINHGKLCRKSVKDSRKLLLNSTELPREWSWNYPYFTTG